MKRDVLQRHWAIFAWIFLTVLVSLCACLICHPTQAQASTTAASAASANITVRPSQTVHDLFIVGKQVDVQGDITDNLVAVDCDIHVAAGAHIDTLLAIGGHVTEDGGSTVRNDLLLTPSGDALNHLVLGIAFVSMMTLVKFVASAFLLFSSVAFHVLLKARLQRQVSQLERTISKSFVIGLVAFVGIAAAMVGLALTGIGLPVAIAIALVYGVIGLIGLAGIALLVGRTVLHQYRESISDWVCASVGALLLIGCSNIPVVGILFFFVAWCTGTSTIFTTLKRPKMR